MATIPRVLDAPRELRTERLLLRRWEPGDRELFSALNGDPRVTEYLPAPLSREESDAMLGFLFKHIEKDNSWERYCKRCIASLQIAYFMY